MFRTIQKLLTIVLTMSIVAVTHQNAFAAKAYPDSLKSMSAVQLKAYYTSLSAKKAAIKSRLTNDGLAVEDVINYGKDDLRNKNPRKALVSFNYALVLDATNQKAYFGAR